jgi:hypothetical protein
MDEQRKSERDCVGSSGTRYIGNDRPIEKRGEHTIAGRLSHDRLFTNSSTKTIERIEETYMGPTRSIWSGNSHAESETNEESASMGTLAKGCPHPPGAFSIRTMPLKFNAPHRTLSLAKGSNIPEIWKKAEQRLGTRRANLSLVYSKSRYLPDEGILDPPEQLFEIRWRGNGGNPGTIRLQYKLGMEKVVRETTIKAGLELEEIRKIIQKLHPEIEISKLYRDHAELDGGDNSTDWATETGSRCQVCWTIEAEITSEEGRDDLVIKEGIMSVSAGAGLVWVTNHQGWKAEIERCLDLEGKSWRLDKPNPDEWEIGHFQIAERANGEEIQGIDDIDI